MHSIVRLFVFLILSWAKQAQSSDADAPLRVLVPLKTGFKAFVGSEDNRTFHGFSIQVFQAAVAQLHPAFATKFVGYGDNVSPPDYNSMIRVLVERKVDAVVGDVTITKERIKIVDFTQPYAHSALVVVVPASSTAHQSMWGFLRPFSWELWVAIATAFFGTGMAILILEQDNTDFQGPLHRRLLNVYWFIGLSLFFSQREGIHTQPGRLVTVLWLLVVLIFTSSYTANLSSSLTSERLSPEIKGFESLKRMNLKVGYQHGSFTKEYLTRLGISKKRLVPLDRESDFRNALIRGLKHQPGGVAAIVDELPYVTTFLASYCNFKTVGDQISYFGGFAFAFPKNSSLTQKLSRAILSIAQNGTLQAIKNHTLGTVDTCNHQKGADRLKFTNFSGLFMILGGVYAISILWQSGRVAWKAASARGFFHIKHNLMNGVTSLWTHGRKGKSGLGSHNQNLQVRPETEMDMHQEQQQQN